MPQQTRRTPRIFTILFIASIGLIFLILGVAILAATSSKSSPSQPRVDNTRACVMAQGFVGRQLKSPKSADFQFCGDAKIERKGNQFTVISYVDSQNAFGAMIRTQYAAVLEWTGGDNWKLLDLITSP